MRLSRAFIGLALFALSLPALAGTCIITEFTQLPKDHTGNLLYIPTLGPGTVSQSVSYTTATQATNAFKTSTSYIRVYCDSVAHIAIGPAGTTATATDFALPAASWEYIALAQKSTTATPIYIDIYDGTS